MTDVFITDARISWDSINAIIGGRSAIDIPRLRLRTESEAEEFLHAYGFDWQREKHRLELGLLRAEAVGFIKENLLEDVPGLWLPPDVEDQNDPRQLLIWASDSQRTDQQKWACAVLRVMHTLSHAESYFDNRFGTEVREQILERFRPHLHGSDEAGWTLGSGDHAIPLAGFQTKSGKPLRSVAIKLLHKVENVASAVFDHVGVRFITQERFDAVLVVRYLRKFNVIMFANAIPSRSRNSLIDLSLVRQHMSDVDERCERGELADSERWQAMREACRNDPYPPGELVKNAHSSFAYHSIQFTCRHHVRVRNSYDAHVQRFIDRIRQDPAGDVFAQDVSELDKLADTDGEIHFFFPFEVQILDQEAYEASRSGQASHAEYKARQRETVRKRVLGDLLP